MPHLNRLDFCRQAWQNLTKPTHPPAGGRMHTSLPNPNPKVAAIHDLSGFGRASLTIAIPVLSVMGFQVCPLPTAVLSSQTTGVPDFRFVDLTDAMPGFLDHWRDLGLRFEAVYSGFLGSPAQAEIVARCIDSCLRPGGLAVVDPVLGDNGKLDPTMTPEMVEALRWLVGKAHCITPNITEAAFLLGEDFPENGLDAESLKEWMLRLADTGPEMVVITSAPLRGFDAFSVTVAYNRNQGRFWKTVRTQIPVFYPGTGDTFASVLTGGLLQGDSLPAAVDRAAQFVATGIRATCGHDLPGRDGILLERVLHTLHTPMTDYTYTILD